MADPHYFIAIHIPEELQDFFASWQEKLKQRLPYKLWYHQQDLHITLKFLGAVGESKVTELISNLKSVEKFSAFYLTVGTIGIFGKPTNPRVLWAGVEKTKELINVQQEVEKVVTQLGFKKEENREYRPHITLAKKWARKDFITNEYMKELKSHFTETKKLRVQEVSLFQIHPNRKQKYEAVKQFPLR